MRATAAKLGAVEWTSAALQVAQDKDQDIRPIRDECAQYFRGRPPRQAGLQPQLSGTPWAKVAIDFAEKHPKSRGGYDYIVTIMDLFTKWAETFPVRDHTASTVGKILLEHVFSRFKCRKSCCLTEDRRSRANL